MVFPSKQALFQQPDELVRPQHPGTKRSMIPNAEHANVEGLDQIHLPISDLLATFDHFASLCPFLRALNGNQFGRDDSLQRQGKFVAEAKFLALINAGMDDHPGAEKSGQEAGP